MNESYCIVMTTFSDDAAARRILERLVEERLAACVQTFPVDSMYRWNGALQHESEILAFIKTKESLYESVEGLIRTYHDYECPEVLRIPVTGGFAPYLGWIESQCL